ncbi:MAG: hypothetical protein LBU68_02940 [Rickettsiales bacterium]|jgi:hypothetical protein|nr:hypothetical protein [Rickettsiales bacterium]
MNKKLIMASLILSAIVAENSANAQYTQQQRPAPGRQNTGWNNGQITSVNQQQRPAYNPQQPQQAITTPYNYYGFPQQNSQGVRVTNGLPGYGRTQNPYESTNSEKGFYILAGFSMGSDGGSGITSEALSDDGTPGNLIGRGLGDTTAFTIGGGTNLSGSLRLEFTYSTYSGLDYYDRAIEAVGDPDYESDPEYLEAPVSYSVLEKSGISSDNFSLGFYYSLKEVVGDFLGGMFVPYIGGSMGLSYNTLGSYTIEMAGGAEDGLTPSTCWSGEDAITGQYLIDETPAGTEPYPICGIQAGYGEATYVGTTTPGFSFGLEAGLTMQIQENIALDFYYKNNTLGSISTSGVVTTIQDSYDVMIDDGEMDPGDIDFMMPDFDVPIDDVYTAYYFYAAQDTNVKKSTKESGSLNITEFGIKLRAFF